MTTRSAILVGALLGLGFGTWNVVVSVLNPVMDDTPLALLGFYGPMFTAWGMAGYTAFKRTHRLLDWRHGRWPLRRTATRVQMIVGEAAIDFFVARTDRGPLTGDHDPRTPHGR